MSSAHSSIRANDLGSHFNTAVFRPKVSNCSLNRFRATRFLCRAPETGSALRQDPAFVPNRLTPPVPPICAVGYTRELRS